jgi:hypothetical protein
MRLGRGRPDDEDPWPRDDLDDLSDEQYWAEVSSDKPLAGGRSALGTDDPPAFGEPDPPPGGGRRRRAGPTPRERTGDDGPGMSFPASDADTQALRRGGREASMAETQALERGRRDYQGYGRRRRDEPYGDRYGRGGAGPY